MMMMDMLTTTRKEFPDIVRLVAGGGAVRWVGSMFEQLESVDEL